VQGLAIRVARALNRLFGCHGRVWHSRYHAHILRSPRELRNALVYVLNNWKKHARSPVGLDPCSSARWFSGWRNVVPSLAAAPVRPATTWLMRVGWRMHGLIAIKECPRAARE
jgi:hypothetical protein